MLKIEANSCEGEKVLHHIPFLSLILIYIPPLLELFLSANNTLSYTARKRNLGKWLKILSGMWRILEQTSSAGQGKESEEKIKSSELQKYSTLKNPSPHPLNYEVENLGQSIGKELRTWVIWGVMSTTREECEFHARFRHRSMCN